MKVARSVDNQTYRKATQNLSTRTKFSYTEDGGNTFLQKYAKLAIIHDVSTWTTTNVSEQYTVPITRINK